MLSNAIHRFLRSEAKGGIVLLIAALAALILSNSPFASFYQAILETPLTAQLAGLTVKKSLLFWINEGLMTVFFLLVGLELKREFLTGHLSTPSKVILPGMAALGGMLVPALIYAAINWRDAAGLQGWAIPVATDIAFALGVLSLFGSCIPVGLRLFLLALTIFDDVGAVIIIGLFHSRELSWVSIVPACFTLFILCCLNKAGVRRLLPYLVLGLLLWACVLKSGVHATVAGVLLAFVVPLGPQRTANTSPLQALEKVLQPWVAYFVMPLFAFSNAGLSLSGLTGSVLIDPVTLGIIASLFLGKQSGVFGFTWLMVKLRLAKLPQSATWAQLYGVALLCGMGFTMSLFIGTLAFQDMQSVYLIKVRLGVLLASLFSGVTGAIVLLFVSLRHVHHPQFGS